MTDRERLKKLEYRLRILDESVSIEDRDWLIDTLEGYIARDKATEKMFVLFVKTIREYDKLMLKRRKELDIYNKEHPKE